MGTACYGAESGWDPPPPPPPPPPGSRCHWRAYGAHLDPDRYSPGQGGPQTAPSHTITVRHDFAINAPAQQDFGSMFCIVGILKGLDPLGSPQKADPRSPKDDPRPPKWIPHHLSCVSISVRWPQPTSLTPDLECACNFKRKITKITCRLKNHHSFIAGHRPAGPPPPRARRGRRTGRAGGRGRPREHEHPTA